MDEQTAEVELFHTTTQIEGKQGMSKIEVLIAGETWVSYAIHQKGFNAFTTGSYEEGATPLIEALKEGGIEVTHMKNHEAGLLFPSTYEEIERYRVIVLSDIGSDTLQLHPDTFFRSKPTPDRLKLLKHYVEEGGGFLMIGGYLSFQGYGGSGHYRFTPIEEILPVKLFEGDDRVELPSGFKPKVVKQHPIVQGIPESWPLLLGYNKLVPEGEVIVNAEGTDPLLVIGRNGKGRTAAFSSDCSPHWGSPEFVNWEYYGRFWKNLVEWLAAVR